MDEQILDDISRRTGLSVEACRNMLENGWTYVEELRGISRWESPARNFRRVY